MNDVFCPQCSEYVAPTWRDAQKEAPPEDVRVLVWYDGAVHLMSYTGDSGQTYRRLPNAQCWGTWMDDSSEGPRQIRWWMFLPAGPK